MPKAKVKFIIFDFGGVIVHGGYLDFIKDYCLECLTPQGRKRIKLLEHQANLGRIKENEFYRKIEKIFHVHLTPKRMHELITRKMQANKSLIHLIPKLSKAKVAVFSNSIGHMVIETMKSRRISKKIFNRIFLSNVIHHAKPDAVSYKYILKKLKVKPKETLFVDDRLKNIQAARKLGMHGIVFKNTNLLKREIKKYELI